MTTEQQAGPIAVETISSYARRIGDRVRVVLDLPELDVHGQAQVTLRLKSHHGAVVSEAEATPVGAGTRLEAEFPAKRLRPGVWRLAARPGSEAAFRGVGARLLTSRTQPIALLVGPAPRGSIAPPKPQSSPTRKQRLARRAGSLVDRALAPLPPEKAARYRATARRSARQLLR